MGSGRGRRNKVGGNIAGARSLNRGTAEEDGMAEDREKITTGPNERAVNETIAGTGPGIPDEALGPGEELPEPPSEEEVQRIARKLGAPTAEDDTLPVEGQ
jgi:hypothetical protein